MVEESNRYAHQKLGDLFKSSIMQAEMKAILGIIITMGIVMLPNYTCIHVTKLYMQLYIYIYIKPGSIRPTTCHLPTQSWGVTQNVLNPP